MEFDGENLYIGSTEPINKIDKNNTIIVLDNNSMLGKVVRLIMDRNCDINDGYNFYQHNKDSEYFRGHNDSKFILVGDIFNDIFLKDISNKDSNYKRVLIEENKTLRTLSSLWVYTNNGKTINNNEANILTIVANALEGKNTPSAKVMRIYLDNFVNILTRGNTFFSKPFSEIENLVNWYNEKQESGSKLVFHPVEENINLEKEFFKSKKFQIVFEIEAEDYDKAYLSFFRSHPKLKDKFNLLYEIKNGEDISSIMEQKLLLESMMQANINYYNNIKKIDDNKLINNDIASDYASVINKVRNRIVTKIHKG